MDLDGDDGEALLIFEMMRMQLVRIMLFVLLVINSGVLRGRRSNERVRAKYHLLSKVPAQIEYLYGLISESEKDCIDILRLGRAPFHKLCVILEQRGGLQSTRGVSVHEQVAMFLSILGHHQKIRVVKKAFKRSGRTVSIQFNRVLDAVLRCHDIYLVTPEPVEADCDDERWKWFKGCLGALDGTYIPVHVPSTEQARYRSRKSTCNIKC